MPATDPAKVSEPEKLSETLSLFDTHCHLDLPQLATEQHAHWQAAKQAGVSAMLIPAVTEVAWPNLLRLAEQRRWFIALGIHPWWALKHTLAAVDRLEVLLQHQHAAISAVGEIGLDFALASDSFAWQQQLFAAQLTLAKQYNKPVILHHRKSQSALLAELKRQQFQGGGILHAFSGSMQQGMAFIEQGFKLGVGGTITYTRAEKTRKAISKLPLSALVLETDAPAMPLAGYQGQINTPAMLKQVFTALCTLRAESPAELAQALWQNSLEALQLCPAELN